jgi:thiamine kinase-like enzyme
LKILTKNLELAFPSLENISPIIQIGYGFNSTVIKTNSNIVFKLAKNSRTQRSYYLEYNLLKKINQYFKEISIPYPIYYKHSMTEFPYGIIGYKEITGKILSPFDITYKSESKYISQFANIINTIHSIPLTAEIYELNLPRYPPSKNKLQTFWQTIKPFLKEKFSVHEYNIILDWWKTFKENINMKKNKSVILHLDLWYENIVINYEEEKIVGILDFGNISLGDPIADLVPLSYISKDFMIKVLKKLQDKSKKYDYSNLEEKMHLLKGLRELCGLEYGIKTGNIDEDTFTKIKETILDF